MTAPTDGDAGLVADLHDLLKQATTERSHYYVASVVRRSLARIEALSAEMERLRREFDEREKVYEGVVQSLISARESRLSSIEAETIERCAKIAENCETTQSDREGDANTQWHDGHDAACFEIATAIRSSKEG